MSDAVHVSISLAIIVIGFFVSVRINRYLNEREHEEAMKHLERMRKANKLMQKDWKP